MEQLGGILIAAACGLGLLLVLAVVWLLNPSIQRGTPARAVKRPEALREGSLQIRRMLSDAEAAFYWALKRAVGDRWVILPRVPLHRVFRRIEHLPREMYTMLENGEVDFLLVHPRSWEPVCGIELDDSTHHSPTRRERDRRKEALFRAAGLPLLRWSMSERWDVEEIATRVSAALNAARKAQG
ncbi:DUF2726 domain-containing protein [Thermoflexus sp.]|uniref:DUF2726 domain-containing protein n=1 Tax=Thermoflexus sp. TaxID=1969742 RepID=UPI0017721D87|nr:DUF2726 domain-containing protein [Thermoflexus sp.]